MVIFTQPFFGFRERAERAEFQGGGLCDWLCGTWPQTAGRAQVKQTSDHQ